MDTTGDLNINPIEIAEGIYWLGYTNNNVGLHCNPYLIREGDEAVLIDGGSRDAWRVDACHYPVAGASNRAGQGRRARRGPAISPEHSHDVPGVPGRADIREG